VSSLQFVRKLSGFINRAVEEVTAVARKLLDSLLTSAEPRNREVEAQRARANATQRFGASTVRKCLQRPGGGQGLS